jgi:DNA-binding MurR/RpiR family transcriptional regulator
MFNNVRIVTASGTSEMFEQVVGVDEDDVVIAFSFPRYSAATLKAAQYCRTTGANVIAITDNREAPLAQYSDCVICAKSDMVSLVDSLVAPLSVVNALIVAVSARRGQELARRLDALENIWETYDVYEKRVEKT